VDSAKPNGVNGAARTGTARVKRGMAEMLKGGVIMDVVTPEQARIAEGAGAVAVMALERVPADIRAQGGVSRMSDPDMIEGIISAVTIPVMAKARIGHFVEAQILQSLGVDYVDESEVLTPADYAHHIDKWKFTVPFVCGATNLGEALRRINEGAAMIRSKGEAGTGDVSNATTHMRAIGGEIRRLGSLSEDELFVAAKELAAPYELVVEVARARKLPVTLFTAGGIATPADAAMMMQLGAEGVFVGSGIFKSGDPAQRAAAIVKATTFFDDPDVLAWPSAAGKNSPCRSKRFSISSNSRSTSTGEVCSAPSRVTFSAPSVGRSRASHWCPRCAPSIRISWCTRCTATSSDPEIPRRQRFSSSSGCVTVVRSAPGESMRSNTAKRSSPCRRRFRPIKKVSTTRT
jgi:pyridoxal 5'-phosphate synthase pdxS subunit